MSLSALGPPISEKLTHENYLLWKAQFLPPVKGAQLIRILDGSKKAPLETLEVIDEDKTKVIIPNPAYETWLALDQQVLGYLISSLHR